MGAIDAPARPSLAPKQIDSEASSDDSADEGANATPPATAAGIERASSLRRKWGTSAIRGSALSILNAVAGEALEEDEQDTVTNA